ncbi:hypothetical protein [Actinomadura sp. 9N215]|uniref:hypothetical protein n=1 Tax=Actinomadura sp. 9N215 TaxID=3375150 RepID=UPI0037B44115
MSSTPTDTAAQLAKLRVDFPEWACRYEELFDLAWEAHRRPYRHPTSGCFTWIRAESAERLREMLAGAGEVEAKAAKVSTDARDGRCTR